MAQAKANEQQKVRLLVSRAGPAGTHARGDEITVNLDEAVRMKAAGQCDFVGAATAPKAPKRETTKETATKKPATEKATPESQGEMAVDTSAAAAEQAD